MMQRVEIVVMQKVEAGDGESRHSHVRERYQLGLKHIYNPRFSGKSTQEKRLARILF